MILAVNSSYSQYPIIKKIGKDSLILMTLKQGDDINKSFTQYQNKLDSLKDSVVAKKFLIDSLNIEFNKLDKKREEYKLRYEERLNMPMVKYQYQCFILNLRIFQQKVLLIIL